MVRRWGQAILEREVKEDLSTDVILSRGLNERERTTEMSGKEFPGRGKSKCTGLEVQTCLACSRNREEARMA